MTDVVVSFASFEEWEAFAAANPFLRDRSYIRNIVEHAVAHGVASAFFGRAGPEQVQLTGDNYRETLLAAGLNPRQRAILELIAAEPWFDPPTAARIYAAEALTPFALAMRGRFPRFIGSEYASEPAARDALYPIEFQDLMQLTLRSDTFDAVITNDVLEHIPDVEGCLRELRRVLRPGGLMLSTFPFSFRRESIVKARLVGRQIEHLTDPEFHGNPAEPDKGSLVFAIPGWDILDVARTAGFAAAEMVFLSSVERGITGAEIAGIFVLRCYR